MTARQTDRDDICGACQLGECQHCDGNHDLRFGPGPAVPLIRCGHGCARAAGRRDKPAATDSVADRY